MIIYIKILSLFYFRETQLDKKILTALLKGPGMETGHQLYLAMLWNRVDIVEEKILVHGKCPSIYYVYFIHAILSF